MSTSIVGDGDQQMVKSLVRSMRMHLNTPLFASCYCRRTTPHIPSGLIYVDLVQEGTDALTS
jgi:hypothetical protein